MVFDREEIALVLVEIVFPRGGILYCYESTIMRPRQFATHCVANWEHKVKLPHVAKVRGMRGQSPTLPSNLPDFAQQSTRLCPAIYPTLPGNLPDFAEQTTTLCWANDGTLPGNLHHLAGQLQMRGQSPR